jgi:hypothetical protein
MAGFYFSAVTGPAGAWQTGGAFWHTYGLIMMSTHDEQNPATPAPAPAATNPAPAAPATGPQAVRPREIGGRDGPEPTRYGDWEKAGRCIDF